MNVQAQMAAAKAFVEANLVQLATDILELQDKAIRPSGPLDELLILLRFAGSASEALAVASDMVKRAAMQVVARGKEWNSIASGSRPVPGLPLVISYGGDIAVARAARVPATDTGTLVLRAESLGLSWDLDEGSSIEGAPEYYFQFSPPPRS